MSKYLAYPFLYDKDDDLRCDFEILTDEISSLVGLLRSLINDINLQDDLEKINEITYHMNPSVRTKVTVTKEELMWLDQKTKDIQDEVKDRFDKFVLPQGCSTSCYSHVIRTKYKSLVRLLSRYEQRGNKVDQILYDFSNLLSGYFFVLSLKLNKDNNVEEKEFISRNYK